MQNITFYYLKMPKIPKVPSSASLIVLHNEHDRADSTCKLDRDWSVNTFSFTYTSCVSHNTHTHTQTHICQLTMRQTYHTAYPCTDSLVQGIRETLCTKWSNAVSLWRQTGQRDSTRMWEASYEIALTKLVMYAKRQAIVSSKETRQERLFSLLDAKLWWLLITWKQKLTVFNLVYPRKGYRSRLSRSIRGRAKGLLWLFWRTIITAELVTFGIF